jgi:membrane associated rhomboid family serine protease
MEPFKAGVPAHVGKACFGRTSVSCMHYYSQRKIPSQLTAVDVKQNSYFYQLIATKEFKMHLSITLIIVIVTAIISFNAFSNQDLIDKLIFYPPAVSEHKQWYRFITCGFIHADISHLVFNMYSFYMFGGAVEDAFKDLFGSAGLLLYILLYLSSLATCLLPTYFKHKDNYYYRSLGASGAVSAIVFTYIFLSPTTNLGLIFIPFVHAPAFLFGVVYLGISYFLDRRGNSRINHSAHFWGALYGVIFFIVMCFALSGYNPISAFGIQVKEYFSGQSTTGLD